MSLHKSLGQSGYIIQKDQIDETTIKNIYSDLTLKRNLPKSFNTPELKLYQENDKYLYLPRFYGIEKFGEPSITTFPDVTPIEIKYLHDLSPTQDMIYSNALNTIINKGGGCLVVPLGYGSTNIAIKLSTELNGKTMIIINYLTLFDTWVTEITKATEGKAKIGYIKGGQVDIDDKDYIICMSQSLLKLEHISEKIASFTTCIIDDDIAPKFLKIAHLIGSKYMVKMCHGKEYNFNIWCPYIGTIIECKLPN